MDADRVVESRAGDVAHPSTALRDWVEAWEGVRLEPYIDAAGYRTVGCGHRLENGEGGPITQPECDALLDGDLLYYADGVLKLIPGPPLAQNQLDALTAFAMNCGLGNLAGSTLRKRVLGGYFDQAALEFARWNIALNPVTGVKEANPGLTKRRAAERAMFAFGDYSQRP